MESQTQLQLKKSNKSDEKQYVGNDYCVAAEYLWTSAIRLRVNSSSDEERREMYVNFGCISIVCSSDAQITLHIKSMKAFSPDFCREFCSILNDILRNDLALEMMHALILIRAINGRLVASREFPDHGPMGTNNNFPENGVLFRGTGFRDEFRHFFTGEFIATIYGILGLVAMICLSNVNITNNCW